MSGITGVRRETEIPLDGNTYLVKPTLEKAMLIEDRFGAIPAIIQRFGQGTIGVREITEMMGIILRGVRGAPDQKKIRETVFNEGITKHIGPVVEFLSNAIRTDEPAEPQPEDAESKAGN